MMHGQQNVKFRFLCLPVCYRKIKDWNI